MSESSPNEDQVSLQLGDIIEIEAPGDDIIDNKYFYIDYIDPNEIRLKSSETGETQVLLIENGNLRNESITAINILSRAENNGYANQNNLLPNTWINIYFTGDVPVVMTGMITNLDQDQIEIKTLPDDETIYIDFAFKGIPQDIPISKIEIRDAPSIKKDVEVTEPKTDVNVVYESGEEPDDETDLVPISAVKAQIRDLIGEADQIKYGADLEVVTQIVDVPESEQRYGITNQTNDLLDELLSTIPNAQRNTEVLNNIKRMIDRFKQLRNEFSNFDDQNNANMPAMLGANYKPLVKTLQQLNKKLYWILPIAKMKKKLYDVDAEEAQDFNDIIPLTLGETRLEEDIIINNYLKNDIPNEENKYIYLLRSLKPYLTPYENTESDIDSLSMQNVETAITSVIDNLVDFNSSVISENNIKEKRFLIQEYGLGQNMLKTFKTKDGKIILKNKKVTQNDVINIKSYLTLPLPVVNFSHVNLPASSIMLKANLNSKFLSYWKFLNENTSVKSIYVEDDMKIEDDYLKKITEYMPNPERKYDYEQYLDLIIPKTKLLFNLIKNNIKGKLSVYAVLSYLEPFFIYQKDLSFMQYTEIVDFIDEKIKDYKRDYIANKRILNVLNIPSNPQFSKFLKILNTDPTLYNQITTAYNFKTKVISDGEFYTKIIEIDQGRLYNYAIAKLTLSLMIPDGNLQIEELRNLSRDSTVVTEKSSECEKYILAKKYFAIDELAEDNGRDTYYDKRYDNTYYDIKNEYDLNKVTAEEGGTLRDAKIKFLTSKLEEVNGINKNMALLDATAMIDGKRKVEDGNYAVVEDISSEGARNLYYKRINNRWERDSTISESQFTQNNKLFCDLNKSCVFIDNKCEDIQNGEASLKNDNIKKIINEFDENLRRNSVEMKRVISMNYELALQRVTMLTEILINNKLKYDRVRQELGELVDTVDIKRSPYEELRDAILGQGDFVKRQNDISQLISSFTRPANDGEDLYWLYCIDTDVPLLPTFFQKLSSGFINGDNYLGVVRQICSEQGTISEDGSLWVDKHSGYTIIDIDYDNEEGFTDTGFKIRSRDILEADFGDRIIQNSSTKKKYDYPEGETIDNIINSMSRFMGIDVGSKSNFIIGTVIRQLGKNMPSKDKYEERAAVIQKKGKKVDSYERFYNQNLLLFTLCYLLVVIQTYQPSINTRKGFPGCIKSFTGFPFAGEEDKSGLIYIACIAYKIKSSIKPWDSLAKLREDAIAKRMEKILREKIVNTDDVQNLIIEKKEWLKLNKDTDIPEDLNIKNWINFLPPLRPVKIGTIQNVSEEFNSDLVRDIKTGSNKQFEKINVMRSKITFFAIKIQELIQKVISEKTAILSNSSNEPFLENACCNEEGKTNTLQYFIALQSSITTYNNYCLKLENILSDVGFMAQASILFDPRDTKPKYPAIPTEFSEKTIYRAFIVYCKYNSSIPINEKLRLVCMEKPDSFDIEKNIEENIQSLKQNGHNYSNEKLQQLMSIINNENLVYLSFPTALNNVQILRNILQSMDTEDEQHVPRTFRDKFLAMIDTFETGGLSADTEEIRDFKNYLNTVNTQMETTILRFLKNNSSKFITKNLEECIKNIATFKISDEESFMNSDKDVDKVNTMVLFIKSSLRSIIKVLPNIIIHSVDYANVSCPKHWKLSKKHYDDLKIIINKHYAQLYPFYKDRQIKILLDMIQESTYGINRLAQNTPFYVPIKNGEEYTKSIFDRRLTFLLFKFYFYSVLIDFINTLDNTDLLVRIANETSNSVEEEFSPSITSVQETEQGVISSIEIVEGNKKELSEKLANLLDAFMGIICRDKDAINFNYEMLMERVHRAKEKEKDTFTSYLKNLTDEEREIEKFFKNNKLEKWSKGLQKGLTTYQKDTYDEERDTMDDERLAMEKNSLIAIKLDGNNQVEIMNENIYAMDAIEEQDEDNRIEAEEFDISHLPDDDDFGENDGDEGFY